MARFAVAFAVAVVAALCFCAVNAEDTDCPFTPGTVGWFEQRLNHFNPTDRRVFKQKYFEDKCRWRGCGSPVFLYICGEGTCSGVQNDYTQQLATDLNSAIVVLEHRYYGDSAPFEHLTTDNLQYLSSKQALFDLAAFRDFYNTQLNCSADNASPWFTFGVSYPGALSGWFALKFPHLTKGSHSSSGVVNAILSFPEFDEQVARSVGVDCANALRAATAGIEAGLSGNGGDNNATKAMFGVTQPMDDSDFLLLVADSAAISVQYGHQEALCSAMLAGVHAAAGKTVGEDVDRVANPYLAHAAAAADAFAAYCKSYYYPIFEVDPMSYGREYLLQDASGPASGSRQWWWQTCSELAYFQVAPASPASIRSSKLDIDYFYGLCKAVFGTDVIPEVDATNVYYGGANIGTRKTIYTNGSQDPWQWASVTSATSHTTPAVVVECTNCAHGVTLRGCPQHPVQPAGDASKCDNPAAVAAAREELAAFIKAALASE